MLKIVLEGAFVLPSCLWWRTKIPVGMLSSLSGNEATDISFERNIALWLHFVAFFSIWLLNYKVDVLPLVAAALPALQYLIYNCVSNSDF